MKFSFSTVIIICLLCIHKNCMTVVVPRPSPIGHFSFPDLKLVPKTKRSDDVITIRSQGNFFEENSIEEMLNV
jgi:hypothetical protein